ncbi:MAG: YHYH domain-containing protein [Acutalibacteraceae bacterium]|nr:YHYH domain-containing protein [Acutalibacteraceae bacterium]
MKRLVSSLFILINLISLTVLAVAHPGNTDGCGGHLDRLTGEYHYHHGFSAHQHENGECPYNFVDKSTYNSSHHTKTKDTLETEETLLEEELNQISENKLAAANKIQEEYAEKTSWFITALIFIAFGLIYSFRYSYLNEFSIRS